MIKKIKQKLYILLRKSQKYTKTDMVYLAKNGFWLTLSKEISSIINLSLTIAFANLLNPEVYGTFKFAISFMGILSIPALSGMNTALIRAVAQGNEGVFYPIIKTKLKWGVLGGVGSLIVASYYLYNNNITMMLIFLIMAGFIPFFSTLNIWTNYLNGKKEFKTLGKYQAIVNILKVSTMILTIFLTQNIFIIIFVHFTSNSLIRFLFLKLSLKKYPPNRKQDLSSIGYGKHLSLMSIISTMSGKIDSILIFHFLGPIGVAVYTFAQTPIKYLNSPLSILSQLALPKLSQRNIFDLKKTILPKMIKIFVLIVPMIIIYILIIPYFFHFLLPKYTQSIIYSQVLALSVLFSPIILINQTLIAHAQKKQLYILKIVVPTLKIILFLILLPLYGIWGMIISLLILKIVSSIISLILLKQIR